MEKQKVTNFIKYIGVNDKDLDLFESQYIIPSSITPRARPLIKYKNVSTKISKHENSRKCTNLQNVTTIF